MKKIAITFVLILSVQMAVYAQNAYYDALALAEKVQFDPVSQEFKFVIVGPAGDPVFEILKRYTELADKSDNRQNIYNQYRDAGNTFIIDFFNGQSFGGADPFGPDGASLISQVGGLNVTTLADGLARFLAGRFKAELNIIFLRQFQKMLEKYPELQDLFPQTYALLSVVDTEIYNLAYFIQSLRSAVEKDLNTIPTNLSKLIRNPDYKEKFRKNLPDNDAVKIAFGAAFLVTKVADGTHPADLIDELARLRDIQDGKSNLANSLQLVNLISQSLIDKNAGSDERKWVSRDDLSLLIQDPNALKIYAGLLYQSGKDISFTYTKIVKKKTIPSTIGIGQGKTIKIDSITTSFREILREGDNTLTLLRTQIEAFIQYADVIKSIRDKIKDQGPEKLSFADYFRFIDATVNILDEGINFKTQLLSDLKPSAFETTFIQLTKHVNNLVFDLKQKRYSAVATDVVAILEQVIDEKELKKYKGKLIKYGAFMAAVAKAENANEVKQAIDAFALPVGSASIKKNASINVSLNAYVGGFAGYEKLKGVSPNQNLNVSPLSNKENRIYGMAAPVGLAISYGKIPGSLTGFISLIDVGALTAFRLQDDTTETLPEIKLENIFAPGLHLIWGIPGVPLSLSVGAQFGPALRKVEAEGVELQKSGFRMAFMLAVDIPLLTFYSKSR